MELIKWTTIIIISICLAMALTKREKANPLFTDWDPYKYSFILLVAFATVLIVVEGLRHGYADTGNYKPWFEEQHDDIISYMKQSEEPGFELIMWIIGRFTDNSQVFLLVVAAFLTISDVFFIKKHSYDTVFSLYLYFLLSFLGNMNGIRQLIAAIFMMIGFKWLVEKKYIRYIILILLLSTIHRSILVVIPLMLVFAGKRWNWRVYAIIGFCMFSAVFPGVINSIIGSLVTDDYSHYLETYTTGANWIHVLIESVPVILGLIYHYRNRENVGQNRAMDILINMQAVRFSFMLLATNMAQYARIGMYMRNSTALVIPFLIPKVFKDKEATIIKILAVILYLLVFIIENKMLDGTGYFKELYLDYSSFV